MSQPWRRIDVFVSDRRGTPLPGATLTYSLAGEEVGDVFNANGRGSIEVDDQEAEVAVSASYGGDTQSVTLAPGQNNWTFAFDVQVDRPVRVRVTDRRGEVIPGATVTISGDGADRNRITDAAGVVAEAIHDPLAQVSITAAWRNAQREDTLPRGGGALSLVLDTTYTSPAAHGLRVAMLVFATLLAVALAFGYFAGMEAHLALVVGLVLAAVATLLAFAFGNVTPLQRQIILTLAALAGGAIATEIPGFLNVQITLATRTGVAAGGAIAVFVILYFWSAPKPPD